MIVDCTMVGLNLKKERFLFIFFNPGTDGGRSVIRRDFKDVWWRGRVNTQWVWMAFREICMSRMGVYFSQKWVNFLQRRELRTPTHSSKRLVLLYFESSGVQLTALDFYPGGGPLGAAFWHLALTIACPPALWCVAHRSNKRTFRLVSARF